MNCVLLHTYIQKCVVKEDARVHSSVKLSRLVLYLMQGNLGAKGGNDPTYLEMHNVKICSRSNFQFYLFLLVIMKESKKLLKKRLVEYPVQVFMDGI